MEIVFSKLRESLNMERVHVKGFKDHGRIQNKILVHNQITFNNTFKNRFDMKNIKGLIF